MRPRFVAMPAAPNTAQHGTHAKMANTNRLITVFHEAQARPAGVERERFLVEAC